MEAYIQDGQSSASFYPTFKILTKLLFKIRFRVVEILLVARHEMSQINTLLALASIYDIRRRAQSLWDYWREIASSQNPVCWESTRCNAYTHNSLKRRFRQPLCDPTFIRILGKTKAWTILLIKDKDLGVFHEVSMINSPPAFALTKWENSLHQRHNPGTSWYLQTLKSDKSPNNLTWIH